MSIHPRTTDRGRVYDVRYRGPGGQNFSRTFLTKRAALEFEAQHRTAKNRGTWIDPRGSKITMRELGQEWLESNPAKRDSTWARDESALRIHVYPDLGERTIGSLTPVDIRRLVAKWSENLAPRSVRRIYGALRAALKLRRRGRPAGEDTLPRHPSPGCRACESHRAKSGRAHRAGRHDRPRTTRR